METNRQPPENQIEWNFDAGRPMSTYRPRSLYPLGIDIPSYPSIQDYLASKNLSVALNQKIRMIQGKLQQTALLQAKIISNPEAINYPPVFNIGHAAEGRQSDIAVTPSLIYEYNFEVEGMVYLMRRVIDSLVQVSSVIVGWERFKKTLKIEIDSIGSLLYKKQQGNLSSHLKQLLSIVCGDGVTYKVDGLGKLHQTKKQITCTIIEDAFLTVINDLFNSFKHSLMHDESLSPQLSSHPTARSYQAEHNDHRSTIIVHDHNIFHLVMGFQDTVLRIFENQKTFMADKKFT